MVTKKSSKIILLLVVFILLFLPDKNHGPGVSIPWIILFLKWGWDDDLKEAWDNDLKWVEDSDLKRAWNNDLKYYLEITIWSIT